MNKSVNSQFRDLCYLRFEAIDRFLFRITDLDQLENYIPMDVLSRTYKCHIYLIGTRPRLSIVPSSIRVSADQIDFRVQYKLSAISMEAEVSISKSVFMEREVVFEVSPYPHRHLITRDSDGTLIAETLLANHAHVISALEPKAKDLEVIYIGKGLSDSASDRLSSHSTVQRILANSVSNNPDQEIFALVYAFKFQKDALFLSTPTNQVTRDRLGKIKAIDYRPSLEEQISLIEASLISYFRTEEFNVHYLNFPKARPQILEQAIKPDIAAILVQLDNTNIGGLRIYSKNRAPSSSHVAAIDLRRNRVFTASEWFETVSTGISD